MKRLEIIDLHTHGTGLFDTRAGSASDILSMAALYGQAGVSAILPTIYPATLDEMRRNMSAVIEAMGEPATEGVARILGVHLEGPFISPKRGGALNPAFFMAPSLEDLSEVLCGFREVIKVMTVAPELTGALKVIERCAELGIRVNMGHSDATYEEALEGKRAGATGVTHIFNAMRPFHHRDPGLAGLGLLDDDLFVELIPDGVHVAVPVMELVFRLKRPEKIILVSDSVKGPMYREGVLQGSKLMLSRSPQALRHSSVSEETVRIAASDNPKRFLGLV